jgi:drug/metabolite transporter (DMT)-like permease
MQPTSRQRLAYALLVITPGMWSANYIVARSAIGVIEPHMLAFLRWTIALALMLAFAWRGLIANFAAWRGEWPQMLALGALGMWICGAFVYIGAETTVAVNISLLYAISPVLIAAGSAVFFADRLSRVQVAGVALALAGTLFVLARGSLANLAAVRFTVGDGWILVAVASWTAYSLLLRKWPSALEPFARLTAICAGGIVVLLPFTVVEAVVAGLPDFSSPQVWLLAVVVALLPGFGSYQAYSYMQRELGAARTGLVLYLGPLWAAVTAWWVLGEAPQWFHFAGAALILPGIYLATRSATRGQPGVQASASAPASAPESAP